MLLTIAWLLLKRISGRHKKPEPPVE